MFHLPRDARAAANDDGAIDVNGEYGDLSCPMGNLRSWRRFNTVHRYQNGWLPPTQVLNVTTHAAFAANLTLTSSSLAQGTVRTGGDGDVWVHRGDCMCACVGVTLAECAVPTHV